MTNSRIGNYFRQRKVDDLHWGLKRTVAARLLLLPSSDNFLFFLPIFLLIFRGGKEDCLHLMGGLSPVAIFNKADNLISQSTLAKFEIHLIKGCTLFLAKAHSNGDLP